MKRGIINKLIDGKILLPAVLVIAIWILPISIAWFYQHTAYNAVVEQQAYSVAESILRLTLSKAVPKPEYLVLSGWLQPPQQNPHADFYQRDFTLSVDDTSTMHGRVLAYYYCGGTSVIPDADGCNFDMLELVAYGTITISSQNMTRVAKTMLKKTTAPDSVGDCWAASSSDAVERDYSKCIRISIIPSFR